MNPQAPQTPYQRRSLVHLTLDQNRYDWDANPSTKYGYASNFAQQGVESPLDTTHRRNLMQDFERNAPLVGPELGVNNRPVEIAAPLPSQRLLDRSSQLNHEIHQRMQRLAESQQERQAEMQRELQNFEREIEQREQQQRNEQNIQQQASELKRMWYELLHDITIEHDRDLIASWITNQRFTPETVMEFSWHQIHDYILRLIPDENGIYMNGEDLVRVTNIMVDSLREYKRNKLLEENLVQPAVAPWAPDERQRVRDQEHRLDRIHREERERIKRMNDLASHAQAPKIHVHRAIDDTIAFETFCAIHKVEPSMMVELYSRLLTDVNIANAVLLIQHTLESRPELDSWAHKRLAIVSTVMGLSKDNLDKPLADLHLRGTKETHAEFEAKFLLAASIKHQKNIFNGGFRDLADYEANGMVNLILEFKEKMPHKIQENIDQMTVLERSSGAAVPTLKNVLAQVRNLRSFHVHESYASFRDHTDLEKIRGDSAKPHDGVRKHGRVPRGRGRGRGRGLGRFGKRSDDQRYPRDGNDTKGDSKETQRHEVTEKHCWKCNSRTHFNQYACKSAKHDDYLFKYASKYERGKYLDRDNKVKEEFRAGVNEKLKRAGNKAIAYKE